MAVDMFLKIDGIEGDSRDAKHKGEIELLSFSWGVVNTTGSTGGGGGGAVGKIIPQDFSIMKSLDKATPKLFERMCEGAHIPEVHVSVGSSAIKGEQEFLKIKLSDVLISSYQTGGSGGAIPVESLSFKFSGVEISTADRKGTFSTVNCNFGSQDSNAMAHDHDKG